MLLKSNSKSFITTKFEVNYSFKEKINSIKIKKEKKMALRAAASL